MPEAGTNNIWALNKDASIKQLLLMLAHDVGHDAFELIDTDGLDQRAVRIGARHTAATAYLFTYGQDRDHCGLHLEYPRHEESNISEQEDMYEELTYDRLLAILKVHLEWQT